MTLIIAGDNCSEPIYSWLLVYTIVAAVLTICSIASELLLKAESGGAATGFMCLTCLGVLFSLAWAIVGSVWVFEDIDCSDGKI